MPIFFAENTQNCGKIKLLKLLYFLDFRHFKETGKSVTGLDYSAWKMGPVPVSFFEELSGNMKSDLSEAIKISTIGNLQKIIPRKDFDSINFSKREKKILEYLVYIFKTAKAKDMIESAHFKNSPWEKTKNEKGLFQPIDYFLAIDDSPASISFEDAQDRVRERDEMYKSFGTGP